MATISKRETSSKTLNNTSIGPIRDVSFPEFYINAGCCFLSEFFSPVFVCLSLCECSRHEISQRISADFDISKKYITLLFLFFNQKFDSRMHLIKNLTLECI